MGQLLPDEARRVTEELEVFGARHDAAQPDRRKKLLNLERATAELLHVLVRASARREVLEVGTSNGYSAIWIAAALRARGGGRLVSLEREHEKLSMARDNLLRAGLADLVDLVSGDATAIVERLPGPFDCVFFDADRISAPAQLRLLLPKLRPDVLLVADNALSHPQELAEYVRECGRLPRFASTTFTLGKGLHVAHRVA